MEPDSFPDLFPFLKWAADQNGDNSDLLYDFLFEWTGHSRESMLSRWGVTPRNDDIAVEVRHAIHDVQIDINTALHDWERGAWHTGQMVDAIRLSVAKLTALRERVHAI